MMQCVLTEFLAFLTYLTGVLSCTLEYFTYMMAASDYGGRYLGLVSLTILSMSHVLVLLFT